jgi:hypothetical protein
LWGALVGIPDRSSPSRKKMHEVIGAATVLMVRKSFASPSVSIFHAMITMPSNLNRTDHFWLKILAPTHLKTVDGEIDELTRADHLFEVRTMNPVKVGDRLTVAIRRTRYQDFEPIEYEDD